ncbi:hypothetical protein PN502_07755 [Microcystis aeruginosa CS-338/01]|nr:hypothetical protein [Microcystis aeruginosa]MDB9506985.1 hypothetical protein [Microcystis aeruginosa CS-338/01]
MSIIFDLERTNQLSLLPDKDLVDLCSHIEPYQVPKSHKSTVRSAIERLIVSNSINNLGNKSVKIDQVTFCHNPSNDREIENYHIYKTENNVIKAKLETVPKLIGLGLTIEQIAQALDLDIQLILDSLKPE